MHLAWLGPDGLAEAGRQSVQKAHYLAERLSRIAGVRLARGRPLRPRVRRRPSPPSPRRWWRRWRERGYLAGIPCSADYPELPRGLLVAVTEKRTRQELDGYAAALEEVLHDA